MKTVATRFAEWIAKNQDWLVPVCFVTLFLAFVLMSVADLYRANQVRDLIERIEVEYPRRAGGK